MNDVDEPISLTEYLTRLAEQAAAGDHYAALARERWLAWYGDAAVKSPEEGPR